MNNKGADQTEQGWSAPVLFINPPKTAFLAPWPIWAIKTLIYQIGQKYSKGFRVPTRQGKVREICFFFKVREKSGNSVKLSGKLEDLQKSEKSQGILKSCLVNSSKIEQTDI